MRSCIFALAVSICATVPPHSLQAQEDTIFGPAPQDELVNPAQPDPAGPAEEVVPNPFRELNAPDPQAEQPTFSGPEPQLGQPGFAEATDQSVLSPSPQSLPPSLNQPLPSRIPASTAASSASTASSSRNNTSFSPRLARAAPIMGDSLPPSLQFTESFDHSYAEIPTGGGATRRKIAENSGAVPIDRVFFNYNHFHNGINSMSESNNIDRYTLGLEKTFFDGICSIDIRLPLSANNDFVDSSTAFRRNGSELGNVSAALKVLLTTTDNCAWAAGLVVDTPTGSGTTMRLSNFDTLKLNNNAVFLAPFFGFLFLQDGGFTHQGFLQVDVATNANSFMYAEDPTAFVSPEVVHTEFQEQTLLYFDYSLAKTLFTSRDTVQRVSGLLEFHYTTTLEDSDVVEIDTSNGTDVDFISQGNRIDVLNLTAGIDTLLSNGANLRVGTVVPITDGDDRFFDIEFLAQVNIPL